jgi:hypothetical protein
VTAGAKAPSFAFARSRVHPSLVRARDHDARTLLDATRLEVTPAEPRTPSIGSILDLAAE